jgi:hypothetical protein
MYKSTIKKLNLLQKSRLFTIEISNDKLKFKSDLKTKQSGLYWVYTKYTVQDFLNATPSTKKNSIDFRKLAIRQASLNKICKHKVEDFCLVYNGIGGTGKKGHGGLRERILEEFRGGEGTGSLAIKDSSLNDLQKWRVSYVLWSEIDFSSSHDYATFSETLERLWRIHYGWPILCTK